VSQRSRRHTKGEQRPLLVACILNLLKAAHTHTRWECPCGGPLLTDQGNIKRTRQTESLRSVFRSQLFNPLRFKTITPLRRLAARPRPSALKLSSPINSLRFCRGRVCRREQLYIWVTAVFRTKPPYRSAAHRPNHHSSTAEALAPHQQEEQKTSVCLKTFSSSRRASI